MALPGPGPNAHVVVTGATSELGAAIARGMSARGYPTVLVDRGSAGLDALASALPDARAMPADLADEADRARVRDVVAGDAGVVGLVTAPEVAADGHLADAAAHEPDESATMLRRSVTAVHDLVTAATGAFVLRGVGAVLIVATLDAPAPSPGAATRAGAQSFTQAFGGAVHAELRGSGVSLTTLTAPPPDRAAGPLGRVLEVDADQVAEAGITGMIAGRQSAAPGLVSQVATLVARVTAVGTDLLSALHRRL